MSRHIHSLHVSLAALTGLVLAGSAFAGWGGGEIITVTTPLDNTGISQSLQVSDLPGPDGQVSFREACVAATNTPGPQTIHFAIPQSHFTGPVVYLLNDGGGFVFGDDGGTIDFTTQTAFTGDTNPNGLEVGIRGTEPNAMGTAGLYVSGDNNTIKGVGHMIWRGYGVSISGNNNRVISSIISGPLYAGVEINGSFNGPAATGNVIGGTAPGEGNTLSAGNSGVRIDGPAENNIVIGNTLTGTYWGAEIRTPPCCPGNDAINNRIGGPTPAERNVIAGAGKYGEEGFPTGGQVNVEYSTGSIVEGNYIGVLADGATIPSPQRGPVGVRVRNSPNTIVRNNVIGGIAVTGVNHHAGQRFGIGVSIEGSSANALVLGNIIGADATGEAPAPNRTGVTVGTWPGSPNPTGVRIGGVEAGETNLIAFNEQTGVVVPTQINGVRISGNSIHSNGALGIDLGSGGVNPNDQGDPDTGANNLQNFPVLTSAIAAGSSTTVAGTLNSTPNTTFELQFFGSPEADSSGHGEGQQYLGSTSVTTDASGNANFEATLPIGAAEGDVASATAIAPSGDTSEFALSIPVTVTPTADADLNDDGTVNVADLLITISTWGECIGSTPCVADIAPDGGDGRVDVADLLMVITHWG